MLWTDRTFSIRPVFAAIVFVGVALIAGCTAASAATYNAAADWTTATSSGTPWAYGSETSLGGSITFYTTESNLAGSNSAIQIWNGPNEVSNVPADFTNVTNQTVTDGSLTLGANDSAFHPGPNGQYSVYQFTAPTTGTYDVSGSFAPGDSGRTDVYILAGNSQIFGSDLATDINNTASFNADELLTAGETVDYAVGLSPEHNTFSNDTTIVDATVSNVPAPEASTNTLFGLLLTLGIGGLLWSSRNRKYASAI